jgi:hypothetical protein
MRIKTFRTFESVTQGLTPEQKSWLNECTRGRGTWSLNAEGLVDVEGGFSCSYESLSDFKGVRFGEVSGDFLCYRNKLTSLEGAPREVGANFWCNDNSLTSLEGAPREVRGGFDCSLNKLTSLEGAPEEVGWRFNCSENKLTSLEGAPREVRGGFNCSENKLTSLEGAPREVSGGFNCSGNKLTSLEGAPREVSGGFVCYANKLTSLEGAPREVRGDFDCSWNNLTSLEGAPGEVSGDFECENNPLQTLVGAPRKIGRLFEFSAGIGAQQFYIPQGQWGPAGWLQALETIDDPKARALILTLLDPDALNKLFRDRPEQTMIDLQEIWNLPSFASTRKQLKVPERYRDDMDLLGDMKELGF